MNAFRCLPFGKSVIQHLDALFFPHIPHLNSSGLSHFQLDLQKSSIVSHQGIAYQHLIAIKSIVTVFLNSFSHCQLVILWTAGFWVFLSILKKSYPRVPDAPYHGYRFWLEPTLFLQARTFFDGRNIINSGFKKYIDTPFVIRKSSTDITILPTKYQDELRLYPTTKLNAVEGVVENFGHKYTDIKVLAESNLHFRVVQHKLTPELPKFLDIAKIELEYGWSTDVPQPDDWREVDIQQVFRMLIARMSAKVFLGKLACRDMVWLNLSIEYSVVLFACAFALRMFPPWMHPIVAPIMPLCWKVASNIRKAERIIGPLMDNHRDALKRRSEGEIVEEDDTLLHWMMDKGDEKEIGLHNMAVRQCILTLASIHTTSMAITNVLFDLCAHPHWFDVLREEIAEVKREFGKFGEEGSGAKQWVPRLEKMDSFFVESQRCNPPVLLAPQRMAMVPITLNDGTHIPARTRIGFSNESILNEITPDPSNFDPMRSYRKRYETGELNKHQAGQPSKENLHFGYGKLACPGRRFALGEIKMILVKLLSDFDFKFPDGKSRPKNFYADENICPDPRAKVMMRKRRVIHN